MSLKAPYFTRSGDKGETSLIGGRRVPKYDLRIEATGTVDELNSFIGLARSVCAYEDLSKILETLQQDLFIVGADISAPNDISPSFHIPRIDKKHVEDIEKLIEQYANEIKPITRFILPSGTQLAAFLHVARTICRRAERRVVQLASTEPINNYLIVYLNRLSSLLFVLARVANARANVKELEVTYKH
ncbi:MAG: cob(I)yrinic acid a,c-diamide adenosyltransferase [Thermoprotei archaeon]|jgi:cob(I)alamin adenosyltransferase